MNCDELLHDVLGSTISFESGLSGFVECDSGSLLPALLDGLDKATIENSEKERRLKSVFQRAKLSSEQLQSVAETGGTLGNQVLRNALAQLLPPELRLAVFRRRVVLVKSPVIQ